MYNNGGVSLVGLNHAARVFFFSFLQGFCLLCACVSVSKYFRIISYGLESLSFIECNRVSYFFCPLLLLYWGWEKGIGGRKQGVGALWEQLGKVDSHIQATWDICYNHSCSTASRVGDFLGGVVELGRLLVPVRLTAAVSYLWKQHPEWRGRGEGTIFLRSVATS